MWSVHLRLAELWFTQKKRPLTEDENTEMLHCLEANMRKALKLAELKNLSLIASTINDMEWQKEICKEIEKVYPYGSIAL